jgi:uncharacterized protein (TIGR03083 family)
MDLEPEWRVIAEQRRSLADLLEGLSDDQWETPSLCERWRVRDVAAHVAMAPTPPSIGGTLARAVLAHGDFNRLNYELAVQRASAPTAAIVESLRRHADSRKLPMLTNARNIHFDILVHTQDIAIPLGVARPTPADAGRAAAEHIFNAGWPFYARRRMTGVRLVADDVQFEAGDGPEIRGPIIALLMLMSGRGAAGAPMLSGEGMHRLGV